MSLYYTFDLSQTIRDYDVNRAERLLTLTPAISFIQLISCIDFTLHRG